MYLKLQVAFDRILHGGMYPSTKNQKFLPTLSSTSFLLHGHSHRAIVSYLTSIIPIPHPTATTAPQEPPLAAAPSYQHSCSSIPLLHPMVFRQVLVLAVPLEYPITPRTSIKTTAITMTLSYPQSLLVHPHVTLVLLPALLLFTVTHGLFEESDRGILPDK
jgi:hypothetical protein